MKDNKFTRVIEEMRSQDNNPIDIFRAQNLLCQLYKFDFIRTFIYSYNEGKCVLGHTCKLGKVPQSTLYARGIDLSETYYGKLGDGTSTKLVSEKYYQTDDFKSIESDLLELGYEKHQENVIEIATYLVSGKNCLPIVLIALERLEGSEKLTQKESHEVEMLMELIGIRIENYENQKQNRDNIVARDIDKLTGIPTVNFFRNKASQLIETNKNYAILSLDIDKFKYINEIWGEQVGDNILIEIGKIIQDFISDDECCARLSADKFAVLLWYESDDNLRNKVENLNKILNNMEETLFKDVKITVIGGIYKICDKMNISLALDRANIARETVKGTFDNTCALYSAELADMTEREKQLEKRMKHALENNEFVPYLQPKFDINTGEICGAEALARWVIGDQIISPVEFISVFEKNGFIIHLDFAIYEGTFSFINESKQKGNTLYPISLNVSRGHMRDKTFSKRFFDLMDKYNIKSSDIELEITESIFVGNKDEIKKFINSFKSKNITIAIDDFGTAYSSLNLLKDIDVDVIKFDKNFLDRTCCCNDAEVVKKDRIIIKNMIKMTQELNFKSVFEGIETDEQISFLKSTGCTIGQGYIFSKPISLSEFKNKYL